jgi:hypothetical protein
MEVPKTYIRLGLSLPKSCTAFPMAYPTISTAKFLFLGDFFIPRVCYPTWQSGVDAGKTLLNEWKLVLLEVISNFGAS